MKKPATQLVECINKFTGKASYKEVASNRVFQYLNERRSSWNIGSARVVPNNQEKTVRASYYIF